MRAYATANALTWRMGDTVHYGAARVSTFSTYQRVTGGTLNADLATHSLKGKLRRGAKVIYVFAAGTGFSHRDSTHQPSWDISLKLGSTVLVHYKHAVTTGTPTDYAHTWRFEAWLSCESDAVVNVRAARWVDTAVGNSDPWWDSGAGEVTPVGVTCAEAVRENTHQLTLTSDADYTLAVHIDGDELTANGYAELTHFLVEAL